MVAQYNLKKARLAFFLGQKLNIDDRHPTMIHSSLIFSDELFLVPDKKLVQSTEQSNLRLPPVCQVDKYAPRYGFAHGGDEMLLSLTRRPEEKKYGGTKNEFDRFIASFTFSFRYQNSISIYSIESRMVIRR